MTIPVTQSLANSYYSQPLPWCVMILWLPSLYSSPVLPFLPSLPSLPSILGPLPSLLQTVVSGGGTTGTTGTTGGANVVTTLPAPVTTTMTTAPMMATMAPGIAIGILKALLVGRLQSPEIIS